MTSQNSLKTGLILGLLAAVGPLAIDMYLPALPAIADGLKTDVSATQATLTAYLIGFGAAQLFYGPISDQVGRRAPLFFGLLLFIVGAIASAFAQSIEALTTARAIQGVGGAVVMVMPRAIIRDIDTGVAATRLMGAIMMVVSVSPMLAPLAGSGVMLFGGWRAIFAVLAVLAALSLLLSALALPETLAPEQRVKFSLRSLWSGAKTLFGDTKFLGLTFIGGFGMASFFVFIASASFVYTGQFGLSPVGFGLAFALNGVGFFLATQSVARIGQRLGMERMLRLATLAFLGVTLSLVALTALGFGSLPVIVGFLFLAFAALGLVIPTTMVLALDDHGAIAGLASSLGGTLQMFIAGGMIALFGPAFDGTALPMVAAIATCAVIVSLLTVATFRRPKQAQTA